MKLTAALLVCTILQVNARGFAQKVSLSERNAPPEKVFTLIERQTGYKFVYTETFLQKAQPITVSLRNVPLEQALAVCFSNQAYTWSILNKMIVVKEKPQPPPSIAEPELSPPPPVDVNGVIRDEKGNPIQGATVMVKGGSQSVATNLDGSFVLKGISKDAVLVISYTGYKTEEVSLRGRNEISLALSINPRSLNEIVVIGYGMVRKRDLTGSVSQVKPAEVTSYPTNNIVNALQGRATGVVVQQNNGAPGGGISVRIRGTNSILGGNEPLYVIDGFPYSGNPVFLQNGDIESIEILKDASSIAIYGSRGANGVIIITTKNGKSGRTLVDLETGYSVQTPMKYIKLMNGQQYAQFYNEQATNDGVSPYFTQAQVDSFARGPNTDWQRLVMHNAPMLTTSLNVSGGNDKTKFSLSTGVFRQDGIIRNSDYNRYTLRGTLSHDISKVFNVSYNMYLTRLDSRHQNSSSSNRGQDLISGMLMAPPTVTPYLSDGSLRRLNTAYSFISNVIVNPLVNLYRIMDNGRSDQVFSNAALTIRPIKDLSIRISGGIQNENSRSDYYANIEPTTNSPGSANISTTQTTSLLNENVVTYSKGFGEHRLSFTGGFTYQDYVTTTLNGSGTGFLSDVIQTGGLSSAATPGIPGSSYQKWALLSWLGRINYSYADKYLATVSWRRDGSSRYSEGDKWSNFPSAALAWHMSSEPFLRSSNVVSDLKLRVSYGATGSTAVTPYQTLNQLSSGYTVFGDALNTTYAPSTVLPGRLKWETTDEWDAGVDAGFLSNRLRLTADVYVKKTKNLLNRVTLPSSMGYTTTYQNVGEIQNRGLEIGVESDIFKGAVKWTVSGNISFNRNKVVRLYQHQDIYGGTIYTGSLSDFVNLLREGQPFGVFYGYKENGYTSKGDIQYADLNKDGKITPDDKTYIGDPNPKFTYGLNSILSYKGFGLTVFIQGTQGNDTYDLNMASSLDLGMGLNLTQDQFNHHWTPTNTNAKYPRVSRSLSGNISNRFVENGSYLRFRNIQLAYNLPVSNRRMGWCRSLQLYASGQNLITLTKYSWYDPDINTYGGSSSYMQGIDYYTYPTYKSVTFGIRCGF